MVLAKVVVVVVVDVVVVFVVNVRNGKRRGGHSELIRSVAILKFTIYSTCGRSASIYAREIHGCRAARLSMDSRRSCYAFIARHDGVEWRPQQQPNG